MKIEDLVVTPIAFRDPPLLNSTGVHEPLALRCIVQLQVEGGVTGLGECHGDSRLLRRLEAVRPALSGQDVFATNVIGRTVEQALESGLTPEERGSVFSAIEVACLDAQGKITGQPVSALLGGAVRDSVPYSGYLFYKWAGHPLPDGSPGLADEWGPALDPAGIVAQAHRMIGMYGFRSLKLKGGVLTPAEEVATIRALAEEFPGVPLRLDPNCAWTPETGRWVARELDGVLEYLEDPSGGVDGMADVAREAPMPLATNMCVRSYEDLPEAIRRRAVHVVLGDHHTWGGLRRTQELGTLCEAFGIGLSMHSNSHLGISLAAMTHLAATTGHLTYACDTHYPWNAADDVIKPGALRFVDGSLTVPTGPGLGVELDHAALDRLHQVYLDAKPDRRDDTGYMRRFRPEFDPTLPRW